MRKFIFNTIPYTRGEFLARKLFLRKSISNKMFHFDYKHITDRLPDSLVKRAYQGLLNHSKKPVPLEMISRKSGRIESYPSFGHRPSGEKLTIFFLFRFQRKYFAK